MLVGMSIRQGIPLRPDYSACPRAAVYVERADLRRAAWTQPDGPKEVEAKALDLMAPVLGAGRANELIAAIGNLGRIDSVSRLRQLLQA